MLSGCGFGNYYSSSYPNFNNSIISSEKISSQVDKNNPFNIHKTFKNTYYKDTQTYYDIYNNSKIGVQESDVYTEGNIRYAVGDGFLGPKKMYYQYISEDTYFYDYDFSVNRWYREFWDGSQLDNNSFDGWWDIENYDLINDKYYLKSYIDIGQSSYYKVWYDKSSYQVKTEQRINFDTFYIIQLIVYIKADGIYNLKLPNNYINR